MKKLMSGNEAIARGAYEAGVMVAAAYPGTPSTEILENIANHYQDCLYSEWSPNEKVATEVAIGAAFAGTRSLVAMKHVGVNVAADPIFTVAYQGVNAGFVLVSADDPGMHSSQNEQDNRYYAKFAKIAMIEPGNSQECKDFLAEAYRISEDFNIPVMLRMTTRVCHSKSLVELGERTTVPVKPYQKNVAQRVCAPAYAKPLRPTLEARLKALEEYANTSPLNTMELNDSKVGIISAGIAHQYVKEVFGDKVSYLKLGFTHPLPMDLIKEFAAKVETLYVIEELEPYMEEQLKAAGIPCIGKELIPNMMELNPDIIAQALLGEIKAAQSVEMALAPRPAVLCAGCPHRGFFYVAGKKKNAVIAGDIGCYTLAASQPLDAMDTCLCMGAGFSMAMGMAKSFEVSGRNTRVFGVLGDSTFLHSGITGAMDIIYNQGKVIPVVLDNRITGMTGHQENPATGKTIMGQGTDRISIPEMLRVIGFKTVRVVDPCDLTKMNEVIDEALSSKESFAIVTERPCVLIKDLPPFKTKCVVNQDKCTKCKMCLKVGCPAIFFKEGQCTIDQASCVGCEVCLQVCKFEAIEKVGE